MIDFEDALKKISSHAKALKPEMVSLEKSLGRVLAEDLRAKEPIPPFRKSTMDGYAVRSQDLESLDEDNPVLLNVIADLPAGKVSRSKLKPNQAIRIMTGAPLPEGADSVVMMEDTEKKGDKVLIKRRVDPGAHIGEVGEDVQKGELILQKGDNIGPAEMGMLASLGMAKVKVARRPVVAVIPTGDELTEPGAKLKPGKIRNSNAYGLLGLAQKAGAESKYLGIAPDKKSLLRKKISHAKKADILVLSGGVSVGDYDLVKDQLKSFGVRPVFWQVMIKPGKPMFFGVKGKQLVFGLPGNPVSAMLCFQLFVKPAIDLLLGRKQIGLKKGKAILLADLSLKPGRRQFLRGALDQEGLVLQVQPFPFQKSGVLKSLVKSNALVVVPPEIEMMEKGEEVDILYLD
jgi:molybdopterin molybdotransferase